MLHIIHNIYIYIYIVENIYIYIYKVDNIYAKHVNVWDPRTRTATLQTNIVLA